MRRNYLKGRAGDRINAALATAGHNFSLLHYWFRNFYAPCYGCSVATYRNHTWRKPALKNVLHERPHTYTKRNQTVQDPTALGQIPTRAHCIAVHRRIDRANSHEWAFLVKIGLEPRLPTTTRPVGGTPLKFGFCISPRENVRCPNQVFSAAASLEFLPRYPSTNGYGQANNCAARLEGLRERREAVRVTKAEQYVILQSEGEVILA